MIGGSAIATHSVGMPGTLFAPAATPDDLDLSQPGLEFTLDAGRHHYVLPLRVLQFTLVDDDA